MTGVPTSDTVHGGSGLALLFMGGTGARRPAVGLTVAALFTAGLPALIANLVP
jgi:hypothetical protein